MGKYQEMIQTVVAILSIFVALYFQPTIERSQGIALFIILLILIFGYFIYLSAKDKINQLGEQSKRLKTLEEKVNYMKEINEIKTKMEVMNERIKKLKGQIDIQTILIVLIVVVLFLYLRSIG